jgi:hypothetical protein
MLPMAMILLIPSLRLRLPITKVEGEVDLGVECLKHSNRDNNHLVQIPSKEELQMLLTISLLPCNRDT